jgi:hypothetical protein
MIARETDRLNPGTYDAFQTILSLNNHSVPTLALLDGLYRRIIKSLKFPVKRILSFASGIFCATAVIFWISMGFVSSNYQSYVSSCFTSLKHLSTIPSLEIELKADKKIAGKGDTITFTGLIKNYVHGQAVFAHVINVDSEKRFPLQLKEGIAVFKTGSVTYDFSVYFSGSNGKSNKINIQIIPLPYLSSIRATTVPPAYTRLKRDTLPPGTTHFSVLPGTKIRWEIIPSRPLQELVWEEKWKRNHIRQYFIKRDTLGPGDRFSIERILFHTPSSSRKKSTEEFALLPYLYNITFKDQYGIKGRFPITSEINAVADAHPTVEILLPENNALIDRTEKMDLVLLVKDDFGIKSLLLNYKVTSDGFVKDSSRINVTKWLPALRTNSEGGRERRGNQVSQTWDMDFMNLHPDNEVELFFTACDNNVVSGPNCSNSEIRVVRFPSIQEIIAETEKKEAQALSFLKSASERQKKVSDKLKRLSQEAPESGLKVSKYELKKILISDPNYVHREGQKVLQQLKKKGKSSGSQRKKLDIPIQKFNKALLKSEKSVPPADILHQSTENQLDALKQLHERQVNLEGQCSRMSRKLDKSKSTYADEKRQMDRLHKKMQENIQKQKDLEDYLLSKIQEEKREELLKEQLLREQSEVLEDLQQAVTDLQDFMKKSMEKQLFSEDILQKMQRIKELLEETIPDSLMEIMRSKMEGENIDIKELHKNLQNLIGNRESFEQSINRSLAMLERLRDLRKLEEWKQQLNENMKRESMLHEDIKKQEQQSPGRYPPRLDHRQESIKQSTQKTLRDIREKSSQTPGWQKLYPSLKEQELVREMDKVRQSLQSQQTSSQNSASQHSQSAVKKFQSMIQALSDFSSNMNGNSISIDIAEIELLVQESPPGYLFQLQSGGEMASG